VATRGVRENSEIATWGEEFSVGREAWIGGKDWGLGDKEESLGLYLEQGTQVKGVVLTCFLFN